MHIQQEQARTKDCINNNLSLVTAANRTQSPVQRGINNNNNTTIVGDFKLSEPVSHVKPNMGFILPPPSLRSEPTSGLDSYIPELDMKMENLCDNNLPKPVAPIVQPAPAPSTPSQITPLSPVLSPIPVTPPTGSQSDRSDYASNKNQSLKARINRLVIRTLAENLEKDKQSIQQQQSPIPVVAPPTPVSTNNANTDYMFTGDTWKIRVFQKLRVVDNIPESLFVTDAIQKSNKTEQVVISVDCEGINLGVKGELTLIEIGTTSGEAFIFDVLACPTIMTDGGLKSLLENEKVIKVIHDCRNDSVNLFNQFKVLLRNVFDTQVGFSKNRGRYKSTLAMECLCFSFIRTFIDRPF